MDSTEKHGISVFNVLLGLGIVLVVLTVVFSGYWNGKKAARDRQRVADISRITESLKNYQADNNSFPEAGQNQPLRLEPYLERWPTAPEPADGNCSKEQNKYSYRAVNNGNFYELSFCLGGNFGQYRAGVQTIKAP